MTLVQASQPHSLLHQHENDLISIAREHGTDKGADFLGYVHHYHHHFSLLRDEPIHLLELGAHKGYSLRMWRDYFPQAQITGIDITDRTEELLGERISLIIGDLDDHDWVADFIIDNPLEYDIIIDDASHTMKQQQSSFSTLFPHRLKQNGIYVIEDTCTSYWDRWGGAYRKLGTTIEFLKSLVDNVNHEAYKKSADSDQYSTYTSSEPADYLDKNIYALYFYKYLTFIYKGSNYAA